MAESDPLRSLVAPRS